jgi:outer membrane murein-binding lipoprotein Lpp
MEPINVDGYVNEQKVEDPELALIQAEIKKQKEEVVLNKKKAQSFKELSKSVEKLSETTEEYLEEKRAAQEEIANYNTKVKCLQSENPGAECDKFLRRR